MCHSQLRKQKTLKCLKQTGEYIQCFLQLSFDCKEPNNHVGYIARGFMEFGLESFFPHKQRTRDQSRYSNLIRCQLTA